MESPSVSIIANVVPTTGDIWPGLLQGLVPEGEPLSKIRDRALPSHGIPTLSSMGDR